MVRYDEEDEPQLFEISQNDYQKGYVAYKKPLLEVGGGEIGDTRRIILYLGQFSS